MLPVNTDDMILYIGNPKDVTRKLLKFITEFGETAVYKISIQKSATFLYTNDEWSERQFKKTILFFIVSKRIKCFGINLRRWKTDNQKTIKYGRKKLKMETHAVFMDCKN